MLLRLILRLKLFSASPCVTQTEAPLCLTSCYSDSDWSSSLPHLARKYRVSDFTCRRRTITQIEELIKISVTFDFLSLSCRSRPWTSKHSAIGCPYHLLQNNSWGNKSFLWSHLYPCLGLGTQSQPQSPYVLYHPRRRGFLRLISECSTCRPLCPYILQRGLFALTFQAEEASGFCLSDLTPWRK